MTLRSDIRLLPLDDEIVVFSEEAQCLVGLNATAAFVVRELQAGTPAGQIADTLASAGLAASGVAEEWVAETLGALASHGMLTDGIAPRALPKAPPEDPPSPHPTAEPANAARFEATIERRYRLLETSAVIRFGHAAQVRLVDAVIGHLAADDDAPPAVAIDIHALALDNGHLRSDVYRNRTPVGSAPRLSMLGPLVKGVLWQAAVNAHDFLFYIHAGVVGAQNTCILLPAAAGSGKSSLTAALVHHGFRYFSDEVALIERSDFRVPPMPLALCVKSSGWDLMARYYPNISALPVHQREDGKIVRYIPPPPGAAEQNPATVSHIVFPRYRKDAPSELARLSRPEALRRLMEECLALRQQLTYDTVKDLVQWIAAIDCYALTFSSLDEAAGLIAAIAPDR